MILCQKCGFQSLNCNCKTSKNKGNYWEADTKKLYTWEELMGYYKAKVITSRALQTNLQD